MRASWLFIAIVLGACAPADRGAVLRAPDAGGGAPPSLCGAFSETDQRALSDQLDNGVRAHGLVGAAMAVFDAEQETCWAGASGLANVAESEAWAPERSFRIGSVTKTFTAALIFLLEADGVLTLDDPLERWVPGYYDGVGVTIRHLLSNTSGIVSYNYVGSFDDGRPWQPHELAQWAVDHERQLRFAPGSQWEYSNTNFVLLGLVIQAASGGTYEEMIQTRLTGPLELRDTYVAGSGDTNPDLVHCYHRDGTDLTTKADPSFGWAAGAIVSTPSDLSRWAVALYGGDVLQPSALTRMVTPTVLTDGTTVEYGLGAFVEVDGDDALYGHTGGIAGYLTYMYFWKADRIALVAMSNTFETDLRDLAAYGWSVPLRFKHP